MKKQGQRGQTLVIFAGGLIGLLALAALAIDLSSVYATQQTERAATDASALAGGQDLQVAGTRSVTSAEQVKARTHALQDVAGRFDVDVPGAPACDPTVNIVDCPLAGTPYLVSISTPAKTTPTDMRSVQVTVRNPSFSLSFARLFGQGNWNVGETSVAAIGYSTKYAVITLQPPAPKPQTGLDANLCKDLTVNSTGTVLNIVRGDIGTNTSATTTNSGTIKLADGYFIDHIDDIGVGGCSYSTPDATWSVDAGGLPQGKYIGPSPLIQDPAYTIADFSNATPYSTQAKGKVACSGPDFPTDAATVAKLTPSGTGTLTCYAPGIYQSKFSMNGNTDISYLMPGAYEFLGGMQMNATLTGGLIDHAEGVVLVFPQTVTLNPNNAVSFLLNTGSATCASDGCRATPALDSRNNQIKTPDGLTITMEVPRDENCFAGTNPIISSGCSVNQNKTISLAGNGVLRISGVIYGPSDNMQINASAQTGYVGQIISWTVFYAGGATLNQDYPGGTGNGILHLAKVCSGGGTTCKP